ncbi:MAG: 3'-5' exoribonuclease YhaM family protein, partial [Thermodesulfobacteriota bacterium]
EFNDLQPEQFVAVQGEVRSFRDKLQLVVQKLEVLQLQGEEVNWADFLPVSSRDPEEMLHELEDLCRKELKYSPWKKLCRKVLRDEKIRERLLRAPAAKAIHHAYIGGLLEHTLSVGKICLSISSLYPDTDREILLVAALFHDLGKAWELEGSISRKYSDQGQLLGHIMLTLEIMEPFIQKIKDLDQDLALHLKHMILSHHGEYEFGSPKRPKTPEALILHFADNMDAKLNTMGQILDSMQQEGASWSAFQPSLERYLYRPVHTADFHPRKEENKGVAKQCSLPLKE